MMNNNNNVNNSYLNFDQLMSLQPPSKENPFANTRVADLFREQARKTPDAIAVEMGGELMTYKELDQRSDLLSSALVETGVMPNDIVAMNLSKNVFQVGAGVDFKLLSNSLIFSNVETRNFHRQSESLGSPKGKRVCFSWSLALLLSAYLGVLTHMVIKWRSIPSNGPVVAP